MNWAESSHAGPALANGVAVLIEASIGLIILSIRWKGVDLKHILLDLSKALFASAIMAFFVIFMKRVLPGGDLIQLVVGGGLGLLIYLVIVYFLGIKEIVQIPLAMLRRKKAE